MADFLSDLFTSVLGPPRSQTMVPPDPLMGAGGGGLDHNLPRPLRLNNPGAIEFGAFAKKHGATGSDGRFAIFPDLESGYRAQEALLNSYMGEGRRSVTSIIQKWAPISPGSPENVAGQPEYIQRVSDALGVGPNDRLSPSQIPQLAEAMAAFESGRPVPRTGGTRGRQVLQNPHNPSGVDEVGAPTRVTRGPQPRTRPMADNTQQRPAPFESIFDFMGPPAALRVTREGQRGATERLGMVQAADITERDRKQAIIDRAMAKWGEIMSPATGAGAPTDINLALQQFAKTPEFFELGQAGVNYVDVLRKLQSNPNAPFTAAPGHTVFRDTPEGLETIGRSPMTPMQMTGPRRPETQIERKRADAMNKIFQDGITARGDLQSLTILRTRLENFHEEFPRGTWLGLAAQYGINVGKNTSDIQIIQSLIDRLTPAARQGLPGAASDRDVAMFKSSLPSLLRTREGNMEILSNLEALAEGRRLAGEIAGKANPEDFGAAAWAELQNLPDPFQSARKRRLESETKWLQETHGIDPTLLQPRSIAQLRALANAVAQSAGGAANVPPRARRLLENLARQIDMEGK